MILYQQKNHDLLYSYFLNKTFESKYFIGSTCTNIVCIFSCPRAITSIQNSIFSECLHDLVCYGMEECQECNPFFYNSSNKIQDILRSIQNNCAPNKKFDHKYVDAIDWVSKYHKTDLLKYVCAKRSSFFLTAKQ